MNHKTDMREALQLCIDAMLHDGVPTDPYHPRRVALAAAEAALAGQSAGAADERAAFDIALDALQRYQDEWDTGLPSEYAQSERIQMECACEAVREALQEARAAAPAPVSESADMPEGCTPADAEMLRAANHALAAEIDRLRRRLRPFAQLASSPLSWAMVEYCIKDDPEKQTLQAPQMQRAFNRAADALREDVAEQPSERVEQDCPHGVDDGACKQCYGEATSGTQGAALSDEQARTVECADSWLRMRGLQTYTDLRDTLFAVLRAIGYTEEFAEANPDLKVSEGVKLFLAASAPTLGESEWPSDRDAAIQACALMILGICKTRPQEVWPKEIEGRIRYMLSKLQPQTAEPKGLTEGQREALKYAIYALKQLTSVQADDALEVIGALLKNGE